MSTILKLADLRLDGGTQLRVKLDDAHIAEIAAQLVKDEQARSVNPDAKPSVPRVDVFADRDGVYWLANGFHRYWAHDEIDRDEIECNVKAGTRIDAVRFAAQSNTRHGLKLTDADKRLKVNYVLDHLAELGVEDNNHAVARFCLVSHPLVAAVKEERGGRATQPDRSPQPEISVTGNISSEEAVPYTTKHGVKATMRTDNIIAANRARKAEAEPEPEPEPETRSQPVVLSRREELAQVAADNLKREHKSEEKMSLRRMWEILERLFKSSGEGVRFKLWDKLFELMSDAQLDELAQHLTAWRSRRRPNGRDRAPANIDVADAPSRAQSH
jgi:hypothetical protein